VKQDQPQVVAMQSRTRRQFAQQAAEVGDAHSQQLRNLNRLGITGAHRETLHLVTHP